MKHHTRLTLILSLFAVLVLIGGFLCFDVPVASAATSTIDPANVYVDDFEGWGTSLAWFANVTGGWSDTNRGALADLIYGSSGLGMNIARYNIGGSSASQEGMRPGGLVRSYINQNGTYDWTVDANQRWWVSAAQSRGANIFEAFSNSPPWFMTISGDTRGAPDCGDNLRSGQEDAFAEYLTEVTRHFRDSWGVTFRTLDPLNEPNATWWCGPGVTIQEGAHIGRSQQSILVQRVGEKLASKGLTGTRVSAPDETSPGETSGSINAYSSTARGYVAQINTHTYGGNATDKANLRSLADSLGKRLWMSEVDGTTGSHDHNAIAPSLWLAARVTEDINYLKPAAWVFWQVIEDEANQVSANKNWGLIHADMAGTSQSYVVTKKYYAMANYTRFIRPGYQIIAPGTSNTVTAYSPSAGRLVIVVYNDSSSSTSYTWDLTRFATVTGPVTPYRTSANENLARLSNITVSNRRFTATANANSITTYVVTGVSTGGSTPTATMTTQPGGVIPQTNWSLRYVDSQETTGEDGAAANAFDGSSSTLWHTEWYNSDPAHPHEIQIDLGTSYEVGGFRYLPRQDHTLNGTIAQYEFYVSADGSNWGSAVAAGTFANNASEKEVTFTAKTGRYVRLRALSEVNGNLWTSAAEINVLSASSSPTPTTPAPTSTYQAENASLGGGVSVDTNHSGYYGTGFVNFPSSGGYIEYQNVDGGSGGTRTLQFRFALGATSARTGQLTINGATQNITFQPTGAWDSWVTMNVTVTLNTGTSNTIRLQSTGQDLANQDQMTVN
ncbi:MAG: discoidin domain-containing protein [Anaerolineae bacterium]|nr:discoidin domain-containing protein [Anaerolineae bacterium]